MSYYPVKFDKKGRAPTDAAQKVMIDFTDRSSARDRADEVAEQGGGAGAIAGTGGCDGLGDDRAEARRAAEPRVVGL
jgi:hypothetical protein